MKALDYKSDGQGRTLMYEEGQEAYPMFVITYEEGEKPNVLYEVVYNNKNEEVGLSRIQQYRKTRSAMHTAVVLFWEGDYHDSPRRVAERILDAQELDNI